MGITVNVYVTSFQTPTSNDYSIPSVDEPIYFNLLACLNNGNTYMYILKESSGRSENMPCLLLVNKIMQRTHVYAFHFVQ